MTKNKIMPICRFTYNIFKNNKVIKVLDDKITKPQNKVKVKIVMKILEKK